MRQMVWGQCERWPKAPAKAPAAKRAYNSQHRVCDHDGILWAADFVDCEERLRRLLGRRLGTLNMY
jgi:hypothetical protein